MTIIVKIGGSLTRGTAPRRLLARLAGEPGLVVVPGGGALADQVRAVQPQWNLSDGAAHRMALLAMEQMAHAMADLEPRLLPARTLAELTQAAARGAALWFPATMTLGHAGITESWDVTSDSLALWLAIELKAHRLVLVKAPGAPLPPSSGDRVAEIAAWSAAGVVDAAFATMAVRFTGDILAVPANDGDRLDAALGTRAGATEWNEEAKEGSRPS
ncbi:amino acid kinase family protein [Xanthobacter versatilis]|uniref:amino acid kinase family protein n=1 Tax=Xanthobacter autotrophicus (strain ATCC BAA-1158 / Py2) TaxID=78245 RepID=UPI00372C2C89